MLKSSLRFARLRRSAIATAISLALVTFASGSAAQEMPQRSGDIAAGAILGTVRLPTAVLAGGETLAAGTYRMRLTGDQAKPAPGQTGRLERYVEYLQGTNVRARALAVIVPSDVIAQVADDRPPARGRHRIDRLKEDDYLRIWFNHGGDHVLLHHPIR